MSSDHIDFVRVLEAYDKDGDTLLVEHNLTNLPISFLEELFGKQPNDPLFFNPYEITEKHLDRLTKYVATPIEISKYDYFIACYQK